MTSLLTALVLLSAEPAPAEPEPAPSVAALAPSMANRIAVEALGGATGATFGAVGGGVVGLVVGFAGAASVQGAGWDVAGQRALWMVGGALAGAALGSAVGIPIGVLLAGRAMGGVGSSWLTVLFGLSGVAAGVALGSVLATYTPGGASPAIGLGLAGGLVGSVLAFEISGVKVSPAFSRETAGVTVKGAF